MFKALVFLFFLFFFVFFFKQTSWEKNNRTGMNHHALRLPSKLSCKPSTDRKGEFAQQIAFMWYQKMNGTSHRKPKSHSSHI